MVTIRLQTQIKTYGKLVFFAFGVHLDSKMAQDGPKMAPRWPKMASRWPKMGQDGRKRPPNVSKTASKIENPTLPSTQS